MVSTNRLCKIIMGKLKSINLKLQLSVIALLLIILIIANIPVLNQNSLLFTMIFVLIGGIGFVLINRFFIYPLKLKELEMEARINERTAALNLATDKLKSAMDELKRTQQKNIQIETQKSLTSIVSGFAHEINNPLTGILGYIDLIELNDSLSAYSKKRLESIKDQAIRIKDIIDELNWLDPVLEQVKGAINLVNMLEKMIKIISKKKENKGISFEKVFAEDNIMVYGNHFALWQVFEGIVENAIEAIRERKVKSGNIQIVLKKTKFKDQVVTQIVDNGGGFTSLEKAFNPFYTSKPRTEKRGIGLAIAYNVIQEHNGEIHINNNDLGATVAVHLPCNQTDFELTENKTESIHQNKSINLCLEEK